MGQPIILRGRKRVPEQVLAVLPMANLLARNALMTPEWRQLPNYSLIEWTIQADSIDSLAFYFKYVTAIA